MSVSVLVPFRTNGSRDSRAKTWSWIERRWQHLLPDAELCVGTDDGGHPFSKSAAVNDAYGKSSGDMLVIVDADSWCERWQLSVGIEAAGRKEHLVVPWWVSYRLTKEDSVAVLAADPAGPNPVSDEMKKRAAGTGPSPASCAMVLCIQRTSFERVGGWDPRFRGWGSEDVSFGLACWSLLGRNEYCMGEAYALHHAAPTNDDGMRVWARDKGGLNFDLYYRYRDAQGHPDSMLYLCAEHPVGGRPVSISPTLNLDDMVSLPEMGVPEAIAPLAREAVVLIGGESITA